MAGKRGRQTFRAISLLEGFAIRRHMVLVSGPPCRHGEQRSVCRTSMPERIALTLRAIPQMVFNPIVRIITPKNYGTGNVPMALGV